MVCPYCQSATHVTNTRSHNNGAGVWRRRRCSTCKSIWTTKESYDLSTTHRFKPRSSAALEPFQRDVLFVSIKDSLAHRKTALDDATALTDTTIRRLLAKKQAVIAAGDIVDTCVAVLESFDQTASAVYKAKHQI